MGKECYSFSLPTGPVQGFEPCLIDYIECTALKSLQPREAARILSELSPRASESREESHRPVLSSPSPKPEKGAQGGCGPIASLKTWLQGDRLEKERRGRGEEKGYEKREHTTQHYRGPVHLSFLYVLVS